MLNPTAASWFGDIAYELDAACRSQLVSGWIVSERDYVSRLSAFLSYPFGPFGPGSMMVARTLAQNEEQRLGADAMILFRVGDIVKIGIYEAKYPRWNKPNRQWDPNGKPRFSDQLEAQHPYRDVFAIWELFIDERPQTQNPPYDDRASSCAWHTVAYDYMQNNALVGNAWSDQDLTAMLNQRPQPGNPSHGTHLGHMVEAMLLCSAGKRLDVSDDRAYVPVEPERADPLRIPIPRYPVDSDRMTQEEGERIRSFMESHGLGGYAYLDLSDGWRSFPNESIFRYPPHPPWV